MICLHRRVVDCKHPVFSVRHVIYVRVTKSIYGVCLFFYSQSSYDFGSGSGSEVGVIIELKLARPLRCNDTCHRNFCCRNPLYNGILLQKNFTTEFSARVYNRNFRLSKLKIPEKCKHQKHNNNNVLSLQRKNREH